MLANDTSQRVSVLTFSGRQFGSDATDYAGQSLHRFVLILIVTKETKWELPHKFNVVIINDDLPAFGEFRSSCHRHCPTRAAAPDPVTLTPISVTSNFNPVLPDICSSVCCTLASSTFSVTF